ncbi:beta-ketoacyl synthase N-terminal-like domain-containing protein, partial [Mycobacterium tuberculosis]|uniref:beta-ketoacyl synthase N-terminal-like domain-containing protein n=1 Tax=Mycobacterium tuberculosis TaxID=1773 RepID=UPI00223843C6
MSRRLWENAGSPEVDTNRLMVSIGTGLGSAEELVFSYLPVRIGGHLLEEFDHQLTRIELRRMGYLQRMSTVLSRRLWENAGSPEVDTNRLMVSIGTGLGSAEELVFSY